MDDRFKPLIIENIYFCWIVNIIIKMKEEVIEFL